MRSCLVVLVLVLGALAGCDVGVYNQQQQGGDGGGTSMRYHPAGYAAPEMHGPELKKQTQDCRSCHGDNLEGVGAAVSCDGCHTVAGKTDPKAWRTSCTFCHGGVADQTGAPPKNLDGTMDAASGTFPPHTIHVNTQMAAGIDCIQCHIKASDVMSPGHVFDSTPGVADVDFGGGLSPQGAYDRTMGCTNNYCHGNGRGDTGVVAKAAAPMTCTSCHPGVASGPAGWGTMSGQHSLHLASATGISCADCHSATTTNGTTIANAALHVNGVRDVTIAQAGFTFDAGAQSCVGTCHGHAHTTQVWDGSGGRYHPLGWAAPEMHGPDLELQRQDCRGCHGATLTGGPTAPSCDGCHSAGWRTNCTFCHGGTVNTTGAPPRDPGAPLASMSASFTAHTKHVTGGVTNAFDCVQCHTKPTDVMSMNHVFDSTPGKGEVTMSAGLSAVSVYNGAGTCSNNYCHGNGRGDNGTYTDGGPSLTCGGCHPGMSSGSTAWTTMSGDHRKHLSMSGVTCGDCHNTVTTNGTTIANLSLHIDKARSVVFTAAGFAYDAATKRCTGSCHGAGHNETW